MLHRSTDAREPWRLSKRRGSCAKQCHFWMSLPARFRSFTKNEVQAIPANTARSATARTAEQTLEAVALARPASGDSILGLQYFPEAISARSSPASHKAALHRTPISSIWSSSLTRQLRTCQCSPCSSTTSPTSSATSSPRTHTGSTASFWPPSTPHVLLQTQSCLADGGIVAEVPFYNVSTVLDAMNYIYNQSVIQQDTGCLVRTFQALDEVLSRGLRRGSIINLFQVVLHPEGNCRVEPQTTRSYPESQEPMKV